MQCISSKERIVTKNESAMILIVDGRVSVKMVKLEVYSHWWLSRVYCYARMGIEWGEQVIRVNGIKYNEKSIGKSSVCTH